MEYVVAAFAVIVLVSAVGVNTGVAEKLSCGVSRNVTVAMGGSKSCGDSVGPQAASNEQQPNSPAAAPEANEPGDDADDSGRRDQERDTRGSRRDDARGDRPSEEPGGPTEGGTDGGQADPSGLGDPVPGTTKPTMPEPPAWEPPDAGGGEHASESAGLRDRFTETLAEGAANALAGKWPDASRNLLHFLANNGEPLEQDVNSMLDSSEKFSAATDDQRDRVVAAAVEKAEASGATGPVTFRVNTPWNGVFLDDNDNWYYALNGISYNQTGSVTVTPPKTSGGKWTYDWSTKVNIRDRYNWDGTKSTQIGPFTVTDEELAELHRKGLAEEYTAVGTSDDQNASGEAP